jgi:1-acyl-sn-glycerol-3-phosphate acyltransferase
MRAVFNTLAFLLITLVLAIVAIFSFIADRSGDSVLRLARVWSRAILRAAGVKLTVNTHTSLDPKIPYVFMANHASASDILSLFVAVPFPVRMIAKKTLGRIPFFGWAMHAGRFIFIDRQNPIAARRSIDEAARRIHSGQSVLLFPEGTRTRDGNMGPFKKGGFHLAIASGAAIVPCGIRGSRAVWPRGSALIHSGAIHIEIGEPISTEGLTDDDRDALLERVHALILEMTTRELSQGLPSPRPSPAADRRRG